MKLTRAGGGRNERLIVTGLITNRAVLAAVSELWDGKLFSSRWANIVTGWCVDYYRKFRKPPARRVESLFDRWAAKNERDKDTVGLVSSFLTDLNAEYKTRRRDVDPDYVADLAREYFDRVRLDALKEEIAGLIDDGDIKEAWRRVGAVRPVELGTGGGPVRPLADRQGMKRAFEVKDDVLITYPGALGEFFGDALAREGLIAVHAPEKRGKSTILLELMFQAMTLGRKVAMFQLGDLSKVQFDRRFYARVCRRPFFATKPGRMEKIPEFLAPPTTGDGLPDIRHVEKRWETNLSEGFAAKRVAKLRKKHGRDAFRLSVHPARTLSVHGMQNILTRWEEQDGWKPDVVVCDYAELFAALDGKSTGDREQVNQTWLALASLRLAKHYLIITATQTDADSYDSELITMKNFSEDKRKHSHVTGSFALNQTDEEKELGLYRMNWLTGRDWAYNSSKFVYAAGCAAIQSPWMFSTF